MRGSIIHDLPRYDRFLSGRDTITIGYPWLTVGAILALDQVIFRQADTHTPPRAILELGSGGSTLFFARRAERVLSIETDPTWAPLTKQAIESQGLGSRVDLRCVTNVESEDYLSTLREQFDLLLVDHAADQTVTGRGARRAFSRLPLAMIALDRLKPTGWLVIDNYGCHGMEHFNYSGWNTWIFDDMKYSGQGTIIARRRAGTARWPR